MVLDHIVNLLVKTMISGFFQCKIVTVEEEVEDEQISAKLSSLYQAIYLLTNSISSSY